MLLKIFLLKLIWCSQVLTKVYNNIQIVYAFCNKGDGSTLSRTCDKSYQHIVFIWKELLLKINVMYRNSIKYQQKVKCYSKFNKYISHAHLSGNFTFETVKHVQIYSPCHKVTVNTFWLFILSVTWGFFRFQFWLLPISSFRVLRTCGSFTLFNITLQFIQLFSYWLCANTLFSIQLSHIHWRTVLYSSQ